MKTFVLLLVGAVGLFYVIQGIVLLYHFRVGRGLADTARSFERINADATQQVLFIGDSTVVGTGASTPETSTAGQFGALYPEASIENLGVNGMKIAEVEERLQQAQREHYNLIVLQVGGNDIMFRSDLNEVAEQLPVLVESLVGRADALVILHGGNVGATLALPKGLGLYSYFEQRTLVVRDLYQQEAAKNDHVFYVDLFIPRGEPGSWNSKDFYANDLFHPSDQGYASWFERMQPVIQEAIGK